MADTGNGATLTQSGFTAAIVSISMGGRTLPLTDVTLLSDTVEKLIAGDVLQQKPITVVFMFDSTDSDNVLTFGASISTTITLPSQGGTAATYTGTCINSDDTLPNLANNTAQEATLVMTPDGATPMAFTAES